MSRIASGIGEGATARPAPAPEPAVDILFDCDTGIDDSMAIAYGAGNGAHFVACTTTHGNVPSATAGRNTVTVLDALGLTDVPVHVGAHRPMAQALQTAEWVHGEDGLGDAGVVQSTRPVAGHLGAAEIVRLVHERPGELTLVAVGPLTNLGLALVMDPDLPRLVRNVVIMGGAVNTAGNASHVGEANVWHDPEAAQLVVEAPWDLTVAGLEITMRTALPTSAIARIEASQDPRARLIGRVFQHYLGVYEPIVGARTCVLHDPLAMALALEPDLATYRLARAGVELRGERSRGQVVADLRNFEPDPTDPKEPGVVRLVDTLDVDRFHENFLRALGA
ncbi:nucleoside hydrolase [Actinotalea ferrariae CF5-4]|uniref:Nucleoside hydrolase n=1 Tax=Actinotalea ferrariae CF5-4 TaxID=948458 RepID=A0A021VV21_9CELL|nr:nucleoside hydrolase [Actinotalea ferrariae]EYR65049.1 nucleoside hydrolase [Actinotalea ferrariae CF5-4]